MKTRASHNRPGYYLQSRIIPASNIQDATPPQLRRVDFVQVANPLLAELPYHADQ